MPTPTDKSPQEDERPSNDTVFLSGTAVHWVIGVVTAIWALNVVAGMIKPLDYQPSEMVHGAFMIIVGGAIAVRVRGS